MIEVRNAAVKMNGRWILRDASINLKEAEVTTVLGPNGAGKSTLLKCLTGILRPNEGDVLLDGRPLPEFNLVDLAKRRAVLSQSTPVTFPFTAAEIVMMGRNPHVNGNHTVGDTTVVDQALDSVDAGAFKHRTFPTLSGGEQQRVQLARVLAQIWGQKRACLFLDEPTAALDLKHQHQVLGFLRTLAKEMEWTIVIVIHDLHLARMYSDKVVFMRQGRIYRSAGTDDSFTLANIRAVFEIPEELANLYSSGNG